VPETPLTPEQRVLRASMAADRSWANTSDPVKRTAPARRAAAESWQRRFENEVDPDRVLPEAERTRRAAYARRAYMKNLALRSARSRAKASALTVDARVADDELAALAGEVA
jgi:hypothetical protein